VKGALPRLRHGHLIQSLRAGRHRPSHIERHERVESKAT
jgi:hypothetical protein